MAEVVLTAAGIEEVCAGIVRRLDAGAAPGSIEVLSERGAQGKILAVLALGHPAAHSPGHGRIEFYAVQQESNARGGGHRARWARFRNAAGEVVLECDVGLKKSGAAIELEDDYIRAGDVVRLRSLALTLHMVGGQ